MSVSGSDPRPELRLRVRDHANCWQVKCPGCGAWGTVDDDQLHGRVSMECPRCAWHETVDFSRNPLVEQAEDFAYIKKAVKP